MNIDPALAGTRLKPYDASVSWRAITNYAAAVQDANPCYLDDTRKPGIVAHPVFPVAVTWPMVGNLANFLESRNFPKEVLLTQVHYTERLILNRLVRPGDQLRISGCLAAIFPHRAGSHALIRLTAKDAAGSIVFTEYIGAMLRGVDCGKGLAAEEIPSVPSDNSPGKALWRSEIPIDPLAPYVYDGCTGISFAIHTSPDFAKSVGLPGIIFQGTATLALALREIVNKEAQGNPNRIKDIACRFSGMVHPGSVIDVICTGRYKHRHHTNIFFEVVNSENQKAIQAGYASIDNPITRQVAS